MSVTSSLPVKSGAPETTRLQFDPRLHKYGYDGKPLTSVTTLVKRYSRFDAEKVAARVAARDGKTTEEVLAEWSAKADRGTKLHLYAERLVRGEEPTATDDIRAWVPGVHDVLDHPDIKPIKAEWRVCSPTHLIGGTIDLVAQYRDGYVMIDWKTSGKMYYEGFDGGEDDPPEMKPPLDHVQDANYYQYALQLNVYRWIVEHEYGVPIDGMWIPHVTERKVLSMPRMDDEVALLLREVTS